MVKALFFFFLLFSAALPAQTVTGFLTDRETGKPIAHALVTWEDCKGRQSDSTDANGMFQFALSDACDTFFLSGTHDGSICEQGYMRMYERLTKAEVQDTLRPEMLPYTIDYNPPDLFFEEECLRFRCGYDTISTYQLPAAAHVASLDLFLEFMNCKAVSKVEILSRYTEQEAAQHGDSLARKRAGLLIDYFVDKGFDRRQFVVKTIPFKQRPLKRPDGKMMPECDVISFTILSFRKK